MQTVIISQYASGRQILTRKSDVISLTVSVDDDPLDKRAELDVPDSVASQLYFESTTGAINFDTITNEMANTATAENENVEGSDLV